LIVVGGSRPPYDVEGYPTRDLSIGDERFEADEKPWYLKRWVLALWGLAVVILIAIIIYGLSILARGNGGSAPTTTRPSQATTSLTSTPSLTPSSTAPTTTESSPETTTEFLPPTTTAPWTQQHPHHHWWRSNLPPLPAIPHVPGFNP
jgi:cytoskeletal protein RodZ